MAPSGFGQFKNAILIGNFGDGHINAYDSTGVSLGQLNDNGTTITIEGLWAIAFPQNNIPAGNQNQLFFTAGPKDENHGLFGYINAR
ncbi:MAG TPA: TIGR03118 family protein [Cytophagaceae bacterium]|nr:TIGR03118 family protein [Cytophagaceae bacterium]